MIVHSDQSISSSSGDDVAATSYYNPNAYSSGSSSSSTSSTSNYNNDDTTNTLTSTQILNPVTMSNYDCTSSSNTDLQQRHTNRQKPQISVSLLSVVCDTPGAYYSGSNAYRNSHVCIGGDKAKMDLLCTLYICVFVFFLGVFECFFLGCCFVDFGNLQNKRKQNLTFSLMLLLFPFSS